MVSLETLKTPALVIDLDRIESNAVRMSEKAKKLGVRLRPHVKTHKCVEAARLQTQGQFGGITVSTLAEAAGFARAGFKDITWAVPLAPSRIDEVADLARAVDRLNVLVDHRSTANALSAFADSHATTFDVLLKIDCGNHRAGVDPSSEDAVRVARHIDAQPGLRFRGVLAHGGHAYSCKTRDEVLTVAAEERNVTVAFAERLRHAGMQVDTVSIGSTPTMAVVDSLPGVTEIRPGNYAVFDVFQATLGICELDDMAMSVLSTVVGVYPDRNTFVIDAGSLALSKDPGAIHIDSDSGFGRVELLSGHGPRASLRVTSLTQEHGVVHGMDRVGKVNVGTCVHVYPNHSCLTAALHGSFHVVRGGEVVDVWSPIRGWNS